MKTTTETKVTFLNELNEGDKFTVVGGMSQVIYVFTQHVRVQTLVFKSCNSSGILRVNERDQFRTKVNLIPA